jgi:hypothetical protein
MAPGTTSCLIALLLVAGIVALPEDEWHEKEQLAEEAFYGIGGSYVEGYTCGLVQRTACSPHGGSCDWLNYCGCKSGFLGKKCDFGPVSSADQPGVYDANAIVFDQPKLERLSIALDAATASYKNDAEGAIDCPTQAQAYANTFQLMDFAETHKDGGADTQAWFGVLQAERSPSGKKELVVAWRGTEGSQITKSAQKFKDLISDINLGRQFVADIPEVRQHFQSIGQKVPDLGYIHKGFYDSIAPYVNQSLLLVALGIADCNNVTLETVLNPNTARDLKEMPEILITGHSLGGALSTVFASIVHAVIPSAKIRLYNFASPRVGDPKWASLFESNTHTGTGLMDVIRVVNKHDPVTMIPTSLAAGDEVIHVGNQLTLDYHAISWMCNSFFIDNMYDLATGLGKTALDYATGCLDIGSHTDYYKFVVAFLRSKGYSKPQMCTTGSV